MEKRKIIVDELSKYSLQEIQEFNNIFPCKKYNCSVECGVYDKKDDANCWIEFYFESSEIFWKNWNKFKLLKAFL